MKRPFVIGLLVTALLFVLAGIGAVVFFTLRGADFAGFDVPLASATAEESRIFQVDTEKPVSLSVDDDAGDVSIVGGDVEAVAVQIVKTAYASTESGAETDLQNIKVDYKQNGNVISLTYIVDGRQQHQVDTVDFIVTVPKQTTVNVENGFGAVDVAEVNGNVNIASDFGDITVKNIEGALTLENAGGETEISNVNAGVEDVKVDVDFGRIKLEKINGNDISISSNSGTINLNNVRASGDLFIKTDFGNMTFENGSAASVTVESSGGKVTLTKVNIRGALTITCDFGDIELKQALAGSYELDSNSGGITIDGAKGNVKAHTDFGSIDIRSAQNVTLDLKTNSGGIEFSGSLGNGPHNIQSDFGSIAIAIPADSKLNVNLNTDFGSITSDIPVTVTLDGTTQKNHQQGTMNGGGAEFKVKTNNGSIEITAIK